MSGTDNGLSRRGFIKASAVAVTAVSAAGLLNSGGVRAEDLPRLEESDSAAKALKYAHDATQVDAATRGGDDRVCSNCQFYTGDAAGEWGPCTLFPGKAVNAKGWCSAWAAKAG